MARFTIKQQIILGFATILCMLAGSTGVNVALLTSIRKSAEIVDAARERKTQAVEIDLVMAKVRVRVNQWLRTASPTFVKFADELLVQESALVETAGQRAVSEQEKQTVATMQRALRAYIESWHVMQGFREQDAQLYATGIAAPGAKIREALVRLRDDDSVEPRSARLLVRLALDDFIEAVIHASAYHDLTKTDDADQVAAHLAKALDQLGKAADNVQGEPAIKSAITEQITAIAGWRDAFNAVVKLAQARADRLTSWTNNEGEVMGVGANALREAGEAAANTAQARLSATISSSGLYLYILSAVTLTIGITVSMVLAGSITRPLSRMTQTLRALAAGERVATIPGAERNDEIGEMAKAAAIFKDVGLEKERLQEAERARDAAALEAAKAEQIRLQNSAEQLRVVSTVADALERLSLGDLAHRLNETFPSSYEKLRQDFNHAMDQLHNVMRRVMSSGAAVSAGSGELATATDDLARRTEQQAASLEQTAAALNEITATVRKTSQSASQANNLVSATQSDVKQCDAVMRDTVVAMAGIERSSSEIGQIIGVIDEIAFQTNLLALNAGVEAARAGESGRGFAVVASEVRALAQRSADAAKQIKTLISSASDQVKQGSDLVNRTGQALRGIIAKMAEVNGIVSDISASAEQQAAGLQQINSAVTQMDQVTQQNAAMVEQSTAASHSLMQETQELSRLTGHFQLTAANRNDRAA